MPEKTPGLFFSSRFDLSEGARYANGANIQPSAVGEYELGLDTLTPCWVRMVIYGTPTC